MNLQLAGATQAHPCLLGCRQCLCVHAEQPDHTELFCCIGWMPSRTGTCKARVFAMHGYLQSDSVRRAAPRRTCSCRLACTSPGVRCVCWHHPPQCLQTLLQPLPGNAHAQHPTQPPQMASAATTRTQPQHKAAVLRGIGVMHGNFAAALRLLRQGFTVSCCPETVAPCFSSPPSSASHPPRQRLLHTLLRPPLLPACTLPLPHPGAGTTHKSSIGIVIRTAQ